MYGMNGFGEECIPHIIPKQNVSEHSDTYYCQVRRDCTCNYKVTHYRIRRSKITTRHGCLCLKAVSIGNPMTWNDIVTMKFETAEIALYTLAGFFVRTIGYAPVKVSWDSAAGVGTIEYHPIDAHEENQSLVVPVRPGPDNGWHIEDMLQWNDRIQKKFCIVCDSYNRTSKQKNNTASFYFQLDCKRGHAVCEHCIHSWLSKKESLNKFSVPIEAPVASYMSSTLRNKGRKYCPICEELMNPFVKVALPGILKLRHFRPYVWLGLKPLYSQSLAHTLRPFYDRYIDWFVTAYVKASCDYERLGEKLRQLESLSDLSSGLDSESDEAGANPCYGSVYALHLRYEGLKRLVRFLSPKKRFVAFAFDDKVPYPEEFLNLDSDFYEFHLDRSTYRRYRYQVWGF